MPVPTVTGAVVKGAGRQAGWLGAPSHPSEIYVFGTFWVALPGSSAFYDVRAASDNFGPLHTRD